MRPSERTQLCNQLLFGELVEILEERKAWFLVRTLHGGTEGWVRKGQLTPYKGRKPKADTAVSHAIDLATPVFCDDHSLMVTLGAQLPKFDGMTCTVAGKKYRFSGQAITPDSDTKKAVWIEKIARRLLHVPYMLGGKSPFGIDADAFVQLVLGCVGISIPRYAKAQVAEGESVDFIDFAKLGDLAFFTKNKFSVDHVGIILPDNRIIHVTDKVRIDLIDHIGIFSLASYRYTYRLRIIKRFITEDHILL